MKVLTVMTFDHEENKKHLGYSSKYGEAKYDAHVVLPAGTEKITDNMFLGCDGIIDIAIPESVCDIGSCAFEGCFNLENIFVDDGNPHYIGMDGVLYTRDGTVLVKFPSSNTDNVRNHPGENCYPGFDGCSDCDIHENNAGCFGGVYIPDSVTKLGAECFEDCLKHGSMLLPKNITEIGDFSFNNCRELNEMLLGDRVTHIGKGAFAGCWSLASIDIPLSVTHIGKGAFFGCETLKDISIPEGIQSIDASTFSGCVSLETVTLPKTVKTIGEVAFAHCKSLRSIKLPDGVEVHESAFTGCELFRIR